MRSFRLLALVGGVLCLACLNTALAQKEEPIDFAKAREIRARILKGETVTPEEKAYFERARQSRAQGGRRPAAPVSKELLASLKPLTEFSATDSYKGEAGGLYGKGENTPPPVHRDAAMKLAASIQPLDKDGKPNESGKIGLVSIGMSNTTQEYSAFMRLAAGSSKKSPSVVLVDGAQGGMEAQAWAEMDRPWDGLEKRLEQAGVSPQQVQVVWMKQARRTPAALGEYPKHVEEMNGHLVVVLQKLKKQFPNLKIAYLSSRIYAGYAKSNLNPEPYAYESAFAVRKLIQDQIKGESALNYDDSQGKALSPLLLWGPYLWVAGEEGREQDDLIWKEEDFAQDGTHPSMSGREKVAKQLLNFFENDSTTQPWFLKKSASK